MSTDAVEHEQYVRALQGAQQQAAKERLALTDGRGKVLRQLVPPLYDDDLTPTQVVDYLGISRNTLSALVRIHSAELREAGYVPPEATGSARFSRRAVIHLALLLRANASEQGNRIKRALGVHAVTKTNRMASHVANCRHLVTKASEIAEAVQEMDPQENWAELSQMDRWQLQGLVVTLAAMVPLEQEGLLGYLAELGAKIKSDNPATAANAKRGHGVARGLAALIPATRDEFDVVSL